MEVKFFRTFSDYDRQAAEARRRRAMADLLAQQVAEPTQYGPGPTPAAAPLVQGLQAFMAARAARKAEEAEGGLSQAQSRAAEQIAGRLTGNAPVRNLAPPDSTGLDEVAVQSRYKVSPQDAFSLALTPAGSAALGKAPVLAELLARQMPQQPRSLQVGPVDLGKLTPESAKRFAVSGNPADIEYRPETPESRIGKPSFGDFTLKSLEEYNQTGNPNVLVAIPKPGPTIKVSTGGDVRQSSGADSGPILTQEEAIAAGFAPGTVVRRKDMVVLQQPPKQRVMPGSITQNVVEERARGRRFADISSRADEFISAIESGQLPLSPVSSAKYQAQRLLDSSRGVQPSGKEPYVRFFDLQRFVNEQVNAILNLAKGPQTEGDALRARQQILDNPNNEKVVVSALKSLQRIYNKESELAEQTAADYEKQYGRGAAPAAPSRSKW